MTNIKSLKHNRIALAYNKTCLHSNACLWPIALCLYGQQRNEGVDGPLCAHNGIAGRGAQGGEGVQTLQGVYEQHDVVDCQITAYLIIHLQQSQQCAITII